MSIFRCDNINDCADKSDEADCSRVSIWHNYYRFIQSLLELTRAN